jgi:hypothetical protein
MTPTRREWLTAMGVLGGTGAVLGAGSVPISAQENGDDSGDDTGSDGDGAEKASAIRVAHFSGDAPNVDVYVDGEAALTDVPYGIVSDYLQVTAGDHTVEITAAGDPDTVVFSGDVTVEPWTAYTAAAVGSLDGGSFEVLVVQDDDLARVRLLHAVPDAPAVDVTTGEDGTDVLFDGVEFGEVSDYVTVTADEYALSVRADTEEGDGDVVADTNVFVAPGGVYTVVARGFLAEDAPAGASLTLDVLPDVATSGLGISDLLAESDDGDGGEEGGEETEGDGDETTESTPDEGEDASENGSSEETDTPTDAS